MSMNINNKTVVFKFALALYDYLIQKGYTKEANELSVLVDSCYPTDTDALKAHLEAFKLIQEKIKNLPHSYQQALEEAVVYMNQELGSREGKEDKVSYCAANAVECRGKTTEDQETESQIAKAQANKEEENQAQEKDQEFQEIELKLKVQDPQLGERILQDPNILRLSLNTPPRIKEYETTYYDTLDHLLIKHQVCYRIRNAGGKYIATIKGFGSSQNGLSIRSEWNRPLTEDTPTLEPFKDLAIGQELESLVQEQELLPIFVTSFRRTALDLNFQDGSSMELALDLGEIVAGNLSERISELELELKSGQVENVLRLGETLSEIYQLKPEEESKYQRGIRLAGLSYSEM